MIQSKEGKKGGNEHYSSTVKLNSNSPLPLAWKLTNAYILQFVIRF